MFSAEKHIFTIPAGLPFARILAKSLLDQTHKSPEHLSRFVILMPTRRACRILQEAFIKHQESHALLLPRIQPIGDLDDEELFLNITGFDNGFTIPDMLPPMPPLQRQIILSRLVRAKDKDCPPEQALALASTLGHLMDQIYTENLSLCAIEKLVPATFADHWQITIDFLKILAETWPQILHEKQMIDQADRRNRLILMLAHFWETHPPEYPIIAAGSTGSIPATARLLSVIAGLPQGRIILPGYDTDLDTESWAALEEAHPQYGFKNLFAQMNLDRNIVQQWPCGAFENEIHQARKIFSHEIMRPSATTGEWIHITKNEILQKKISQACAGINILECKNENEEAGTIALLIRETLETPHKTTCLITPDRNLAARVQASCRRWGLEIDDSAGQSFERTELGQFLILVYDTLKENFAPLPLLALLKHNFCTLNLEPALRETGIENIDLAVRGLKPAKGLAGLQSHIEKHEDLSSEKKDSAITLLKSVSAAFMPLLDTIHKPGINLISLLKAHLKTCEHCAQINTESQNALLWSSLDGKTAARFFSTLLETTDFSPFDDLNILEHYEAIFLHFIKQLSVRPVFGTHPRIQILGQLEARMIDADLVILSGLNEGTWPPESTADPWMSRPMRKEFGLPSLERSIGLAAHDFVQGFCSPNVVITRSEKSGSVLSVPARWLQRLNAVIEASNLQNSSLSNAAPLSWTRTLDYTQATTRAARPVPCPPLDKRPNRLSVTRIETWLKDPYSIYARSILKLQKLKTIDQPMDAAAYGDLLHKILENFMGDHKENLPADMQSRLKQIATVAISKYDQEESTWRFWWPKFNRITAWLESHEKQWRTQAKNLTNEAKGEITFNATNGPFTLFGYADRIDRHNNGGVAIIDYKSGGSFSLSAIKSGDLPQLPLEALLASQGGFSTLGALKPRSLQYWILNGRGAGGQCKSLEENIDETLENTRNGLLSLIETYQNPHTTYPSLPRADKIPRFNDYEHLARVQEWAATGDDVDIETEP